MAPRLFGRRDARLHHENVRNDLQTVENAVLHFKQQHFFLAKQPPGFVVKRFFLFLNFAPIGLVYEREQNSFVRVANKEDFSRVHNQGAAPDARKDGVDFKVFRGGVLRQDLI
ncbi:hypothetical protein [Methylocystis sp. SB2]|uniref:hypothetical protein n=1 Tax=Methylocystis sp. (strain SB2) TaxID=743836 RepID=UPI0003FA1F48|nr:hypothetical protein [Methylocystis sp. SB2]